MTSSTAKISSAVKVYQVPTKEHKAPHTRRHVVQNVCHTTTKENFCPNSFKHFTFGNEKQSFVIVGTKENLKINKINLTTITNVCSCNFCL